MTTLTVLEVTAPSLIVLADDGTMYEVRGEGRQGQQVSVPLADNTPDFSQAGWVAA